MGEPLGGAFGVEISRLKFALNDNAQRNDDEPADG